jgi:hypothetical protein
MNACGGMDLYLYSFLTFAVDGGEGLASHPSYFTLRKDPLVSIE